MVIIWIAVAILAIFLLSIVIRCALGRAYLKRVSRDSLIVFGKKGKGKTLLFSEMTRNAKNRVTSRQPISSIRGRRNARSRT